MIFPGDGKCSGSTREFMFRFVQCRVLGRILISNSSSTHLQLHHLAELAYNYIADVSARNISGVFTLDDLPYSSETRTCNDTIAGVTPSVGIEGWTELPSNNYKSVMNALAKVRSCSWGMQFALLMLYGQVRFLNASWYESKFTV